MRHTLYHFYIMIIASIYMNFYFVGRKLIFAVIKFCNFNFVIKLNSPIQILHNDTDVQSMSKELNNNNFQEYILLGLFLLKLFINKFYMLIILFFLSRIRTYRQRQSSNCLDIQTFIRHSFARKQPRKWWQIQNVLQEKRFSRLMTIRRHF